MKKVISAGLGRDELARGDTLGWSVALKDAKEKKIDSLDDLEMTINNDNTGTLTPNALPSNTQQLPVAKRTSQQFNDILDEVLNEKK